jgi:hypothetical protein
MRIYQADNTTLHLFTKESCFKSYKNKARQRQNNETKNREKRGETHERKE